MLVCQDISEGNELKGTEVKTFLMTKLAVFSCSESSFELEISGKISTCSVSVRFFRCLSEKGRNRLPIKLLA